ncbi:MAG: rRNA cytosine-C5-methyltransferase [Bacteroidales bacterium]
MINIPELFIERVKSQKYIDAGSLVSALDEPSQVSIRVNPGKWDRIPLDSEGVPWCKEGYYLKERPSYTLDPLFHAGAFYPQEASSMFIGHVFSQISRGLTGVRVLDLCGAPGGKSTHLSAIIADNGLLVANEVIRSRSAILAESLTKWGVSNCIVTNNDPSDFSSLGGFFDIIIADAPCSGEGMFRDEVARTEWSVANTNLCSERQKRILMDAWPSLKPGGYLIYSTCTFNPSENEGNVSWLNGLKGSESVEIDTGDLPGITVIREKGVTGYGFHPGRIKGEGFFAAVIRKTDDIEKQVRFGRSPDELKPSNADLSFLSGIARSVPEKIARMGDNLVLLPVSREELARFSGNLRIVKAGTVASRVIGREFIPQHDLAVSIRLVPRSFNEINLGLEDALAYLRRDNIRDNKMDRGWNLVRYNGLGLGFIKNIGNRTNNYYPVEWRVRLQKSPGNGPPIISWIQNDLDPR